MKKKHLILFLLCMFLLTGCTTKNGRIPSRQQVKERVLEKCPNEKMKLVNVIEEDSSPKKTTYYFESKERDLTFTAVSTLSQMTFDGTTLPWYSRVIRIDYVDQILNSYKSRVDFVKVKYGFYQPDQADIFISDYNDIEAVAKMMDEISDIYEEELNYNTEKWMDEYFDVYQYVYAKDTDGYKVCIGRFQSYLLDYDMVLNHLQKEYARYVQEGRIPDDGLVPDSVTENVHKDTIENIYMKGTLLTDEMGNEDSEYNRDENVFSARYNYDYDCYMIRLDCAVTPKECGSHPLKVYAEKAGGKFKIKYNRGKAKWTIDGNKFELKASQDSKEDYVEKFVVKKNGKDLNIRFISKNCGATYMLQVPLDDFCKMFDVQATIDEEGNAIYLN